MQDTSVYRPELLIDELREAISESVGTVVANFPSAAVDGILLAVLKTLVARKLIRLVVAPGVGDE